MPNLTYGTRVNKDAYHAEMVRQKETRALALRNGASKNDLPPFSKELVKASANQSFLEDIGVDGKDIISIMKWQTSAVTGFYGGSDPKGSERYLSNLIDEAVSKTSWYKSRIQTGDRAVEQGRKESLLVDFSWYYEARRIAYLMGEPIPEYPQEFIDRAKDTEALELAGATKEDVSALNAPSLDREKMQKAISRTFLAIMKRRYGDINETLDENGRPALPPIFMEDGKINPIAAMKEFRSVRQRNAVRAHLIRKGELAESAPLTQLSDDFVMASCDEEFLKSIGLPDPSLKTVLGVAESYKNDPEGKWLLMRRTLSKYIGGRSYKDASKKDVKGLICAQWISHEFKRRKTAEQKFIDEFKRENSERASNKVGGKWPPFSDSFLMKARDKALLERIGVPLDGIEKIMSIKIPDSGLDSFSRNSLSIAIGMNIRNAKLFIDSATPQKERKELSSESGIVAVYKELMLEKQEMFASTKYGKDGLSLRYSDSLIDKIFVTPLMKDAKEAVDKGARDRVERIWISMLPDSSVLPTIGLTKERLLRAFEAMSGRDSSRQDAIAATGDSSAVFVASIFSILTQCGYESGKGDEFWDKLSDQQKKTFRMAINIDIKKEFEPYKKAHPDLFPAPKGGFRATEKWQKQQASHSSRSYR